MDYGMIFTENLLRVKEQILDCVKCDWSFGDLIARRHQKKKFAMEREFAHQPTFSWPEVIVTMQLQGHGGYPMKGSSSGFHLAWNTEVLHFVMGNSPLRIYGEKNGVE